MGWLLVVGRQGWGGGGDGDKGGRACGCSGNGDRVVVATKVIWVVVAVQMVVRVVLAIMTVQEGCGSRGRGGCIDGDGYGKCS
ncbi:unnamed protein product [Prunus armeniaca]|uniref:Uncharacterized protein n=1 Tax=Prunus armeniaca TaxID=36596 RepID=A0A6J5X7U6_PRUAR|nr:unnamed protein product [Prunus armeniaca]